MKASLSLGDICNGIELFNTERSVNEIDTLRRDNPAVEEYPTLFLTSFIFPIGNLWGRKN